MQKKENFYKIVNGNQVKMTNREVKAYIMKVNNWTTDEYNKNYDILRNKLRAFEAYENAGKKKPKASQSVQGLLFKEAKAKRRMGADYEPSIKMQRIRRFTSISSGKAGKKALQSERYKQRRAKLYTEATFKQFQGLIETNKQAKQIYNSIDDPIKREEALTDFATQLKAKVDEQDRVTENEAIPVGETYGSTDTYIDFDMDAYL